MQNGVADFTVIDSHGSWNAIGGPGQLDIINLRKKKRSRHDVKNYYYKCLTFVT